MTIKCKYIYGIKYATLLHIGERRKMKDHGFTLIELMIVIVIIGIISSIALAKYDNLSDDAKKNACRANMRTIAGQETIYFAGHDTFTSDMSLIGMERVICPTSTVYQVEVPESNVFNITCPEGHGSINDGVPSWHN